MLRSTIAASLVAVLALAGCGPAPSASPGESARVSAGPSATVPSPSPGFAGASFVPAAGAPSGLKKVASTSRNGVRLSIRLVATPLRMGEPADVLLTVENTGAREVRYVTDGCELAADVALLLVDGNWIGGVEQSGVAAEFKAAALEPFGHSGSSPLSVPVADPAMPPDVGCADLAITKTIPAGQIVTRKVTWTGDAEIAPAGRARVFARFSYDGHTGDPPQDEPRYDPIVATLDTWIESDYVPAFLPPGPAIDAALADPTFAAWLAEAPSSTWVNTHHILDVEGRTWTIGLFRDPTAGFYGSVILDAATGEAIGHRFE